MMVLIDREFNQEQLLLETFFPKMHIVRDTYKKVIFKFILGVKTPIKKVSGGGVGVLICCLGHHSQQFSALKLLPAHFCYFPPHWKFWGFNSKHLATTLTLSHCNNLYFKIELTQYYTLADSHSVALKCVKWQKFYKLQCGRKLSQHAARIYYHNVALKCHKVAKLYNVTMWQNIVTTCSQNLLYVTSVTKSGISVLFSAWFIFCHKLKIKLQFCHLHFVIIWFQFLHSG